MYIDRILFLTVHLSIFCLYLSDTKAQSHSSNTQGWQRSQHEYLSYEVMGKGGMVTADHTIASKIGVDLLKQGGDAVDAAVGTALALGVLQPFASGIGGGGFAVVYRGQDKRAEAFDFREVAPGKSHKSMYLDKKGDVIPQASTVGALAAAVPGEVAGLYHLHKLYGKLPWSRVVMPAVKLAKDGFEMHDLLYKYCDLYKKRVLHMPVFSKIVLNEKGDPYPIGTRLRFPRLAKTLSIIAQQGAEGFYKGKVAQELVKSVQNAGGIINLDDLQKYAVKKRKVMSTSYRGYTLYTMPPPSSGGIVIMQALKVLESSSFHTFAHNQYAYLHKLIETLKHGFADRANYMGDPDFYPIPIEKLLSDKRTQNINRHFKERQTQEIQSYGGKFQATKDGGTSHFNVIDAQGNAIALTTTVNTTFASQFIAGNTGVLMNNEMDDFITKPGTPNAYGLIGHKSNEIQAYKKPLSSMSPTIVTQKGKVKGMVGGSGGPTIITGTLQVLLNLIHQDGENGYVGRAVTRPRVHHQWMPNVVMYDQGYDQKVLQTLSTYGHQTKQWPRRFTSIQALWLKGDQMMGSCDPSKRGKPSVVIPQDK